MISNPKPKLNSRVGRKKISKVMLKVQRVKMMTSNPTPKLNSRIERKKISKMMLKFQKENNDFKPKT
jgi:hypothetical protein